MPDPIAEIETFQLAGGGEQGAYGAPYGFIVKVTTRSGIVGYGESDTMPAVADAIVQAPYLNEMMGGLRHVLIGADGADPRAAWERMRLATLNYGRDGATRHAMAAIDIALWDIAGKSAGMPVHVLLGQARRTRVPAYASHPLGNSLDETRRYARALVDQGFRAVKFGWHPLGPDEETDIAIVRTLREAVGPDVDLLIDGGMAWDTETAISRAERFSDFGIRWLEEPLRAYDIKGYRALSRAAAVPIAAGEMAASHDELAPLLEQEAVSVLQVDISRTGLTEAMRIAALAASNGIPCVNHTYSYILNAAASIHFACVVEDTVYFECQVTKNEIRDALDRDQLKPIEGHVHLPSSPGLGVTVDEKALRQFRIG